MQLPLVHHPITPPSDPDLRVWASVDHAASFGAVGTLNLWLGVGAASTGFVMPDSSAPRRADGLWETTCFEAFLRANDAQAYREWNFAPSGDWAAYDFSDYRERSGEPAVKEPYIRLEDNLTWWALGATVAIEAGPVWHLGLSVVLEQQDGTKSYWALAHPDPEKPDFHHPDCFVARLA